MCGVVGAIMNAVTPEDIEILKRVFLETEIRGKHASGIAWYDGTKLNVEKAGVPISEFLKSFDLADTIYNNRIRLIGHIRYSTSDIHYHQPIGDNDSFIVHNGVISQEDPKNWKKHYGYTCSTKNDSELLYECIKVDNDFEKEFPGCSVSALYIDNTGEIKSFRNGKRPQWIGKFNKNTIYASTKNILLRAGIKDVQKVHCDNEMIHRSLDV